MNKSAHFIKDLGTLLNFHDAALSVKHGDSCMEVLFQQGESVILGNRLDKDVCWYLKQKLNETGIS